MSDRIEQPIATAPTSIYLDIYGYRAEIRSSSEPALSGLAEDFAFFRRDSGPVEHVIELLQDDPSYDNLPGAAAPTIYTPRNVSYRDGKFTLVDYSGRGLGIHDRESGDFRLYSRDPDLLYEGAYLFLLSQSGEALDARNLHRVHALGVSIEDRAALILLPMGGGKSTLGSQLLRFPEIRLLSDDSPIIDRMGNVYAFPLRLGLLPGSDAPIPAEQMRTVQRMEFGPKMLVSYSYFANRIRPNAVPCLVFLGERSLSQSCQILRAGKRAALRAMFANCVVGLGLFQGLEFVLQRSPKEVLAKGRIAFSRLIASLRLLRRSRTYRLVLGRDSEENGRVVFEFLKTGATEAGKTKQQTRE